MKRIISVILSIVLLLSLVTCLSACGEGEGVALFTGKKANFTLIRSKDADVETLEIAKYFRQAISDTHGVKVTYKTDETKFERGKLEVNLGVTNRPEAQRLFDKLTTTNENYAADYAILFKNDVIYIVGATNPALQKAVDFFLSNFCGYLTSTIPADLDYMYHFGDDASGFNIAGDKSLSDYQIVFPKYNMSYLVGMEIDNLVDTLMYTTGSIVKKVTDNKKETKKEIIVGETKRGNAPIPSNTDEFIIKMKGGKLYINGATDECTAMALKELCKMAEEGKPISKDFEYIGSYSYSKKNFDNVLEMTWNDEFDTLDTTVWTVCNTSSGQTYNKPDSEKAGKLLQFSNKEENVAIENGNLVLRPTYNDEAYIGAELRTERSVWYKYGLIEISMKLHNTTGLCSAFWTLGFDGEAYTGETDIFESMGKRDNMKATTLSHANDSTNASSGTCYGTTDVSGNRSYYQLPDGDTFDDCYHTIGVYWDEKVIHWVYNGQIFLTVDTTSTQRAKDTFNGLQQIILTQYSGIDVAGQTGIPDETTDWENAHFTIDSLRLYQTKGMVLQKR